LETVYTNLHLYNLAADVNLRGGRFVIRCLRIASDFGKAALDVNYDSSDIDSLNMQLGVAVKDINIVKFFRKFHALLEMMPEMSNLSGMISAEARMSGDIFPDMYVNVPSAVVNAEVEGRELKVHQSEFIRKITRMMLIRTDDDIHIRNIDVHALAHDNLLQLDPFNFEFDRYRLTMLGINNFNGELYYHIAVDKSPVPFPFSINIEGMFHHPKLRFGGPDYDTSHAERITSEIQEENSFNMVQILHKFLRAFIGRAARSDQ
ncbi:MAG: AsmA-like C-terminal region-containing protein, partial [Muribaculaceae bacterium]|nr:AsmA-like C-terminal region-containing protein [Muribaculaceae bacterium]